MKKQILILEDDEINQELLGLYLDKEHYITIVASVESAIDAVTKSPYDLIISDLNLGNDQKSDGLDFLKFVRSQNDLKDIPIVAYSGYDNPDKTNEIKFSAYIIKPITKSDFLKTVNKILFPSY